MGSGPGGKQTHPNQKRVKTTKNKVDIAIDFKKDLGIFSSNPMYSIKQLFLFKMLFLFK